MNSISRTPVSYSKSIFHESCFVGSCGYINLFGDALIYKKSGCCSFLSIFGIKIYKRVGQAFCMFGLLFNSIKNGHRSIVRLPY